MVVALVVPTKTILYKHELSRVKHEVRQNMLKSLCHYLLIELKKKDRNLPLFDVCRALIVFDLIESADKTFE